MPDFSQIFFRLILGKFSARCRIRPIRFPYFKRKEGLQNENIA